MRSLLCGLSVVGLLALAVWARPVDSKKPGVSPEGALQKLFVDAWAWSLRENPIFASMLGHRSYDHKLPDVSAKAQQRRAKALRGFLSRLAQIPRQKLSAPSQLNRDLFSRKLMGQLKEIGFQAYLIPITNRTGFHISFADLPRRLPLRSLAHYRGFVSRLKGFKAYAQQHIAVMRRGMKAGFTLPKVVLKGYGDTIRPHVVKDPKKSLLYRPFAKLPKSFSAAQKAALQKAALAAIRSSVVPGYRLFHDFMTKEYIPKARSSLGASSLPRGKAFYAHRVEHYTTTSSSAKAIHELGKKEVARIRAEMLQIIKKVKFKGDFAAFLKFLRSDRRFYAKSPEALLAQVSLVLKRMDGQLPRLFRKLPRMPYGIRKIPAFIAPKTTTAYYLPPSGDGRRAGFYYVNTHNLNSRPLYEVQALSFHEAVPGHHLQIALQQELKGLPTFRRFYRAMAFQEGWALYAERLGLEVGFYRDPYSNFGRLTYEMWRACRLVVDTGLHQMGWKRKRAIDYMAKHTALALHNITAEVDRYIAWPGQALAYKMGELKIRALRAKAQKELGKAFDLRRFHEAVLENGAIPLDLLEAHIRRWIAQQKKGK